MLHRFLAISHVLLMVCALATVVRGETRSAPPASGGGEAPTPCWITCLGHGQVAFDQCIADGGDQAACKLISEAALLACLESNCGDDPPSSSCPLLCHALAANSFRHCVLEGGLVEFCAVLTQVSLQECMSLECLGTDEPPCELLCRRVALARILACVEGGQDWQDCERLALGPLSGCQAACHVCEPGCGSLIWRDEPHDAVIRRTDSGDSALDPGRLRIDLQSIELGRWTAPVPTQPLLGEHDPEGHFLHITVVVAGVVNPPGPYTPGDSAPFTNGPNPIFGFIEFDVDRDVNTGGELHSFDYRYLANSARFGGLVADLRLRERTAQKSSDLDHGPDSFMTEPFVERSGEEFHLGFMDQDAKLIMHHEGDDDSTFEAGETWWMEGRFLHRAHGFEDFSFAKGLEAPGRYEPYCHMEFRHDVVADETTIRMVCALTLSAGAWMPGEVEPVLNHTAADQSSVEEALWDLQQSAMYVHDNPPYPDQAALILGWDHEQPLAPFLEPTRWRVTALLGTSYDQSPLFPPRFVWTDIFPDVVAGDVDGSAYRTPLDWDRINDFVARHDADDGTADGRVVLPGFAAGFAVFDISNNGVVDSTDLFEGQGDADRDGDVDFRDLAWLQRCQGCSAADWPCGLLDLDGTGVIDRRDAQVFVWQQKGPAR